MAKKIRIDFSKTEERSGWNTRHIAEGLHKMKIESYQETEAQDGTAMLVYALVPEASAFKSRKFPYYCKIQQNQLWKLRDLIVAAGGTVPKKAVQIDPSSIVGKFIAAEVEDDVYQGNVRSQVNGTYALSILEDGEGQPSDEDDEEYEDESDEGEEPEDDEAEEEEEEEEEEVDLSTLSLAELRKIAKDLGIDTAGLKKADLVDEITDAEGDEDEEEDGDDEDELGEDELEDEELEDEEFEDDEEEEEAPAPTTRRKPVAKPAAKAAPAKRVIKRR